VSQLAIYAAQKKIKIEWTFDKHEGYISCIVSAEDPDSVDELEPEMQEIAIATKRYRGNASREEVKFEASSEALRILEKRAQMLDSDDVAMYSDDNDWGNSGDNASDRDNNVHDDDDIEIDDDTYMWPLNR